MYMPVTSSYWIALMVSMIKNYKYFKIELCIAYFNF